MPWLIFFTLLAVTTSFVCSILEATLLSITPAFVAASHQENPVLAKRLKRLKDNVEKPLSAILSLNTIANTIGAAGVGAQAALVFGSQYVGAASAILTLLILYLAEIIPKSLGANYWKRLAPAAARILPVLITCLFPLVWLAMLIARRLRKPGSSPVTSREELSALAEIGATSGAIDNLESTLLQNMLRFSSLKVSDIMTPRTVVFAKQQNQTISDVIKAQPELPFSRIPIYGEDIDDTIGFVLKSDILMALVKGEGNRSLYEFCREIPTVPDFLPLFPLFEQLTGSREHIALVVDEYGGVEGIVTLEDVIETLLGLEIMDELDQEEDMQKVALKLRERRRHRLKANHPGPENQENE
ncbi:MAG: hemolysin [Acidobacteria bacterium]|nr:MAG: hemolysin [Acidobacteriota bacterium]